METLFTFLFKYRPFFFTKGSFSFQWGLPWWIFGTLILLVLAVVFLAYRKRWLSHGGSGWVLPALRVAFFAILLLLAMRPSLILQTLVPKENLLAVLVDNSRSMGIADELEPRGKAALQVLDPESSFIRDLEDKFYLRTFKFAGDAESSALPLAMDWSGDQTNIAGGIDRVLAENRNLPLAGIVIFSDGSDNSYRDFKDVLSELKARQVPVYTVGVGPEKLEKDIEITHVSTARVLLPESVTSARVTLRQQGFGGSRGRLEVREGNVLVQSREVYFPPNTDTVTTEVPLSPKTEGTKTYHFTLQPLEGERIKENNSRTTTLQVKDTRPRILYVEGHPRWEYKFIRQAVGRDKYLRLETLLRTALSRFYRQGIEDETALAAGFPSEREDLFDYKGIIFGSVESSFFTYPQMELVRDFVSKRGGGFLMLGGSSSFASGKYQNTPIEPILPVSLQDVSFNGQLYAQGNGTFSSTDHGGRHPVLQLSLDGPSNDKAWGEMPPLIDWNLVSGTKPGTTVLAQLNFFGTTRDKDSNIPLLAFHRFGRGQAMALLTGSSWRWQMLRDSRDQSHETFWRQMLRWMVSLSKDPVTAETEREVYSRNEMVKVRAEVNDKSFNRINDARVDAEITSPSGVTSKLPLRWSAREDGVYEGQWPAQEDGLYQVRVDAQGKSQTKESDYGSATTLFLTATGSKEYFGAAQNKDFLQRLAADSGGRYYDLKNVDKLPEEIVYSEKASSQLEVLDLWDMPVNLLLLLGLLTAEWVLRKKHGTI